MSTAIAVNHAVKNGDVGVDLDRFKGTSLIASNRGKPRVKEPLKNQNVNLKPEKQLVIKPAPDINVTGATIISPSSVPLPNNELSKWAGMPLVSVTASIWAAKNAAKKQKSQPPQNYNTGKNIVQQQQKPIFSQSNLTEIPISISGQRQEYHEVSHPPPNQFRTPPPPVSPAPFQMHRFMQPPVVHGVSQYPSHHPLVYSRSTDLPGSHVALVPEHTPLRVCHSSSDAFLVNPDHSSGSDEGSGIGSDGGLPRIIKPRKRRKKDKRLGDLSNPPETDFNDNVWQDKNYAQFRNNDNGVNPWGGVNCGSCWPTGYPSPPLTPSSANRERRFSFSSSVSSSEEDVIASLMTLSRISTPPPSGSSSSSALSWTMPVTPPFEYGFDNVLGKRYEWINEPNTDIWNPSTADKLHSFKEPVRDSLLQVSSEIISSPYGHRDIEIKFFSNKSC